MAKKPKLTQRKILEYIKDQFFSSYEGEWEELLDEIRREEEWE